MKGMLGIILKLTKYSLGGAGSTKYTIKHTNLSKSPLFVHAYKCDRCQKKQLV